MRGLLMGVLMVGIAVPAAAQTTCARPVLDKFCAGTTPKDVKAAYGKELDRLD